MASPYSPQEQAEFGSLIVRSEQKINSLMRILHGKLAVARNGEKNNLQKKIKNFHNATKWSIDRMKFVTTVFTPTARQDLNAGQRTIDALVETFSTFSGECETSAPSAVAARRQIGPDPAWQDFMKRSSVFVGNTGGFRMMNENGEVELLQFGQDDGESVVGGPSGTDGGLGALRTLFTPHIPMTPIQVRSNSSYLREDGKKNVVIRDAAYPFYDKNSLNIPCSMVLNEEYKLDHGGKGNVNLMQYLGFIYPDECSLPYIPIMDVTLRFDRALDLSKVGTEKDRTFLPLLIDTGIYLALKEKAKELFLREHPGMKILEPQETELDEERMHVKVAIRGDRKLRLNGPRGCEYPTIVNAMNTCRHDLRGRCQLQIRFSSCLNDKNTYQLRFILFGLMVTLSTENRDAEVFRISWNKN